MTAYEARDMSAIRRSSQVIAYFILALYLFCVIGEYLNVGWTNPALPLDPNGSRTKRTNDTSEDEHIGPGAIIVIAAYHLGYKKLAGVLNGCIIFSALSAANSSLYVASRILYGMTRDIHPRSRFVIFKGLGRVWNKTGVPVRALWLSFISFVWLPFLRLKGGIAIASVRSRKALSELYC